MKETTLREILKHDPCLSGLKKLLNGLKYSNPVTEDEKDLPIKTLFIFENNGYDDCLWSLRCFSGSANWYRFKADIAESVLKYFEKKYPDDNRPRLAIEASRNLADNLSDPAARSAAYSAARSARSAADSVRSVDSAADSVRSADSAARSAADSARSVAYSAARSVRSAVYCAADSVDSAYSVYSEAYFAARFVDSADSADSAAEEQRQLNIEILKKYIL